MKNEKIFSDFFVKLWKFFEHFFENQNFHENIWIFEKIEIFPKCFLLWKKKELRKKSNYHFDVELCQESIFGIDKCNGTLWVRLLRAQKMFFFKAFLPIWVEFCSFNSHFYFFKTEKNNFKIKNFERKFQEKICFRWNAQICNLSSQFCLSSELGQFEVATSIR